MNQPVLQVKNLHYEVGRLTILHHISFSVNDGAYVSVIGPNGAGKTSLIKCLNRINPIASGTVEIFGKPLTAYTQRQLARHLSYVPQAADHDFPFSVFEFVIMGRYPHLSPFSSLGPSDKQKTNDILELTGLRAFAERPIHTLSGGERQKVFVAAALAQGARILLLDEPTTFLDYRHQVEVLALLSRLNKQEGITVISVTHDVNGAVFAGDQVIALKNGTIAFDGSPRDLIAQNALEDVYDTTFQIARIDTLDSPIVIAKGPRP